MKASTWHPPRAASDVMMPVPVRWRRDASEGRERRRRARASAAVVEEESGQIHGAEPRSHVHRSQALAAQQPTGKSK